MRCAGDGGHPRKTLGDGWVSRMWMKMWMGNGDTVAAVGSERGERFRCGVLTPAGGLVAAVQDFHRDDLPLAFMTLDLTPFAEAEALGA